jgi:hypothetical protein
VTRAQLVELGMSTRGISDWVRSGRLQRLYRGIYAVGHDRLMREGRWLAAVLACGPGAVLSHRDAAVLLDLRQSNSAYIDVTVPSRNGRKRQPGIRLHRSGRLPPDEVTVKDGIPVTTVARTLLDLADVLQRQALKRVITEAEYLNLFDLAAINAVVQNNPGRRGAKLIGAIGGAGHRTRSKLEDRFLALLERHAVEEPETGTWIEGYETDFLWRDAHLVVERDGLAAHRTTAAMKGTGVATGSCGERAFGRCGSPRMTWTSRKLSSTTSLTRASACRAARVPPRSLRGGRGSRRPA